MPPFMLPAHAKRVVIYLKPINLRWGATKLHAFCQEALGIEPDPTTAFLFTNKAQDGLILYWVDEGSDQTLTKKLDRGAFLLPAQGDPETPYVSMKPAMLPRLFRS